MTQPLRGQSLDDLTLQARELARMLKEVSRPYARLQLAQRIDAIWQEIQARGQTHVEWRVRSYR